MYLVETKYIYDPHELGSRAYDNCLVMTDAEEVAVAKSIDCILKDWKDATMFDIKTTKIERKRLGIRIDYIIQ